jgi:hypothetical protein
MPEFIVANFGAAGLRRVYEMTGLPEGIPSVENAFIPETTLVRFITAMARLSGESEISLILAPHLSVRSYGIIAQFILAGDTLGDCLQRCGAVLPWHSSHGRLTLRQSRDLVRFGCRFAAADAPDYEHLAIAAIAVQVNMIREYAGADWLPDRIEIDIAKPASTSMLEQVFPCPIRFDAPDMGIVFPREQLKTRPKKRV